jgi:hypothetical protein
MDGYRRYILLYAPRYITLKYEQDHNSSGKEHQGPIEAVWCKRTELR